MFHLPGSKNRTHYDLIFWMFWYDVYLTKYKETESLQCNNSIVGWSVYAMDEHQDSMINYAFANFCAVKELQFLFVFCTIFKFSRGFTL
jgi:hypothetical protein